MSQLDLNNPNGGDGPKQEYRGCCHCGRVKFTALIPELRTTRPFNCDCSICTKNGYLLVYVRRDDVKFVSGYDDMTTYLFATKTRAHRFCPTCGTSVLIDFVDSTMEWQRPFFAVNIRNLDGIQDILPDMTYTPASMRAHGEPYVVSWDENPQP